MNHQQVITMFDSMTENEVMIFYFANSEHRISINKNQTQLISDRGNLIVYSGAKKEFSKELGYKVNRQECKLIINTDNVTFIKIMEE